MKVSIRFLSALLLTVLLSSCGSGSDPKPVPKDVELEAIISGETITLKGQIDGWNQSNKTLVASFAGASEVEVKAPINSNGDFSVVVGKPLDLSDATPFRLVCNPNSADTIKSEVSISQPTSSKLLRLSIEDSATTVIHLSSVKDFANIFNIAAGSIASNVGLYYFANDSVVSGEEACTRGNGQSVKVTYNLNITEGWNRLVLTGSYENDPQVLEIFGEIAPIPSNVSWFSRN